jgi:uncharacterized protein YcbX
MEGISPDGHRDTVTDERLGMGAPPGTFFDLAPMAVLTSATLARLGEAYPQGSFDARRFRMNLIVEVDSDGFVENEWVGRTLVVGDGVRLPVALSDPRCVMTTLAQGDLPRDPGILRAAAEQQQRRHPGRRSLSVRRRLRLRRVRRDGQPRRRRRARVTSPTPGWSCPSGPGSVMPRSR